MIWKNIWEVWNGYWKLFLTWFIATREREERNYLEKYMLKFIVIIISWVFSSVLSVGRNKTYYILFYTNTSLIWWSFFWIEYSTKLHQFIEKLLNFFVPFQMNLCQKFVWICVRQVNSCWCLFPSYCAKNNFIVDRKPFLSLTSNACWSSSHTNNTKLATGNNTCLLKLGWKASCVLSII